MTDGCFVVYDIPSCTALLSINEGAGHLDSGVGFDSHSVHSGLSNRKPMATD